MGRRFWRVSACLAAGLLGWGCGAAGAVTMAAIPLFDTGVSDAGAPLGNGSGELHFTLASAPSGVTTTLRVVTASNGSPVPPWLGNDAASAWIGPSTDQILDGPAGTYDYRLTFSLTGLVPNTAEITGQWAADDLGSDILINGVSTGDGASGPKAFTAFSITSGFVSGTNTLDFLVTNKSSSTGVRVEMAGLAVVAEPGSLAVLGVGLMGMGVVRRVRRGG